MPSAPSLRVLTWHVHGSYLWYLSHVPVTWYVPVRPGGPEGYGGRAGSFPWPDNVVEVAADDVGGLDLDVVLTQSHRNWREDRAELLSAHQRALPVVHLEHDPPRESPADTRHPVDDPDALVVHVTHFNDLMWDCGRTPTVVVEHGVVVPDLEPTLELDRGVVVVNDLPRRGRRLGLDVFEAVRQRVPLDLVGMGSTELGGLGEVPPQELAAFVSQYRFFFHPVRYTSLGLAVCEAMSVGVPIVGLATTELVTVVTNGVDGFIDTDVRRLLPAMRQLVDDPALARRMGAAARRTGRERFGIDAFVTDWLWVLRTAAARRHAA